MRDQNAKGTEWKKQRNRSKKQQAKEAYILNIKARLPLWLVTMQIRAQDKMAIFVRHPENTGSLILTRWVLNLCLSKV